MLCWCCTTASRAALSLLRDCRLCFLSTEDSALSSTFPAFFYPSSPTLSLSISLPSPHHPYPWFFPLTFTSISPSFSLPPFFLFLHPHIWNGGGGSYWLFRQNQRNRQPISFQANRVTIIHEAVQLRCCLHSCHVHICRAYPHTYSARFSCAWASFLMWNNTFIWCHGLPLCLYFAIWPFSLKKNKKFRELEWNWRCIWDQFMHSGQSYVHIHHKFSPYESSTVLLFKDCWRKSCYTAPLPLLSASNLFLFFAVYLPHRQLYICTRLSQSGSVLFFGMMWPFKLPLLPCD